MNYKPDFCRAITGYIILALIVIPLFIITGCTGDPGSVKDNGAVAMFLVGSYSGESGNDIYLAELNIDSSAIKITGGARVGDNPSFLSYDNKRKIIYAVNETDSFKGEEGGGITTLSLDGTQIRQEGSLAISGSGPCHIAPDLSGDYLFVSCYGDGSLSVVGCDHEGLPEIETVFLRYGDVDNKTSHVHMAQQEPETGRLLVSDLGYDRLLVYNTIYAGGNILVREESRIDSGEGSGPRHFVYDNGSGLIYVLHELSSELSVIKRYITGDYMEIARISTLPEGFRGENYAADIKMAPGGKYIYTTNRGDNSIAVFSVGEGGMVKMEGTVSSEGDWPRNIAISPDGQFIVVANQRSGSVVLFKRDMDNGFPEYTGSSLLVNDPSCIIFTGESEKEER